MATVLSLFTQIVQLTTFFLFSVSRAHPGSNALEQLAVARMARMACSTRASSAHWPRPQASELEALGLQPFDGHTYLKQQIIVGAFALLTCTWMMECSGTAYVVRNVRMACPTLASSLQGSLGVSRDILAANGSETGSGWKQSK